MTGPVRILLVSGSTRSFSTNTAALRTMEQIAPSGVVAVLYGGLAELPAFNPDHDHDPLPSEVESLRAEIERADAVIFSTPEYAGTLPGSFKNLLDWTVGSVVLSDMPVAWINVASEGRGHGATEALRVVLGYVGAVAVEAACRNLPVPRDAVGPDGAVGEPALRRELADVLAVVAAHARTAPPGTHSGWGG